MYKKNGEIYKIKEKVKEGEIMIIQVRKVENGYIIRDNYGTETIFFNISEVFSELLLRFEGKSEFFKNNSYGKIKVITKEGEK